MYFILQKESSGLNLETYIVQEILERNRYTDEYIYANMNSFSEFDITYPSNLLTAIPIGTIEFVEKWLKRFYQIDKINPIEVPLCLQTDEFLKREYSILTKDKIPTKGTFFLKDVTHLKTFSGIINGGTFFSNGIWEPRTNQHDSSLRLDPTHLFQVSEVVNIQSESRIYVQNHQVEVVANYNGDPLLFPDRRIIQKMVNIYSMQKDCPKAYTMDVAINERGTFLLEIHPWISVGLYNSLWNRKLLYAYRDGIQYVLDYNTEQKI